MKLEFAEFEAINALTRQTDYRGLCDCLLNALACIEPRFETDLQEVDDDRGYSSWQAEDYLHFVVRQYPTLKKCRQPHWLGDAIPCATAPGNVVVLPQENGLVIGFGTLSGLCRFAEMRGA